MEAAHGMTVRLSTFASRPPTVDIGSAPARADVFVNGSYVGTTPVAIELRHAEHEIVFRKKGYADRTYRVSRTAGSLRRASWTFSAA